MMIYWRQSVKTCVTVISLMGVNSITQAGQFNDAVICPAVANIKEVAPKLDGATSLEESLGLYNVFTTVPAFRENSLSWIVWVNHVRASSRAEAIGFGKASMQNVGSQDTVFADCQHFVCACNYDSGRITAMGTMGY